MRIDKIILKDYRQYHDLELKFNKKDNKNDLHILIGKNDVGKTNLLNAINWCLYGDEPHLGEKNKAEPILNNSVVAKISKEGGEATSLVELWTSTSQDQKIRFIRSGIFRIHKGEHIPRKERTDFKIIITYPQGSSEIIDNIDDAQIYVNRFIPFDLRQFFFFDGEHLNKYFLEATSQHIKNTVFEMSDIDLLQRIEEHLECTHREIRAELSGLNPNIEKIRKELEINEKAIDDLIKRIKETKDEITISVNNKEEYEGKLRGKPDIKQLKNEQDEYMRTMGEKEDRKNEKDTQKNKILIKYFIIFNAVQPLSNLKKYIKNKKDQKELPPTIDPKLLKEILEKEKCEICGQKIDSISEKYIKELLTTIKLSSTVGQELLSIDSVIKELIDQLNNYEPELKEINKEISYIQKEIEILEIRIREIDDKIRGHNVDEYSKWIDEVNKWRVIEREQRDNIITFQADLKYNQKNNKDLKAQLDDEIGKLGKHQELKNQLKFSTQALETIDEIKKTIMTETRTELMEITKKIFFELIWKKESYRDIDIDEDYNVRLLNYHGLNCIGSVGAAVRQFLALSFTLALHKISGFESQILIDTPAARTTSEHRENLAHCLAQVSKDKQIILLFTPDEYSEDISKTLDNNYSTKNRLYMIREQDTTTEVL